MNEEHYMDTEQFSIMIETINKYLFESKISSQTVQRFFTTMMIYSWVSNGIGPDIVNFELKAIETTHDKIWKNREAIFADAEKIQDEMIEKLKGEKK